MTTNIHFLGFAAFEITNSQAQVILVDPFLEDNEVSPLKVNNIKRIDLILVTHLAHDHLGDAAAVSKKFNAPVVCGPEVKTFLEQQGANPKLITPVSWGVEVEIDGIRVRGVECHHTSFREAPDGRYLSGPPLSFIIYADPGIRIYHSGDTALFSDLKLIGELYKPNVGLLCGCLIEQEYLNACGLDNYRGNEMSGEEAAIAAKWLGLETAIICHYMNPDGQDDVKNFLQSMQNQHSDKSKFINSMALHPGESFEV